MRAETVGIAVKKVILPADVSQEVFDQTMFFLQTADQTRDMMHPSLCQPPYSQSYWHYYGQSLQRLQRR